MKNRKVNSKNKSRLMDLSTQTRKGHISNLVNFETEAKVSIWLEVGMKSLMSPPLGLSLI